MSSQLTPHTSADDPVTRWQHIVESLSDDPDMRARLEVVARFADATVAAAAGRGWLRPPVPPSGAPGADVGAAWAQVALAWYDVLTDVETRAKPDGPALRCRADAAMLREWLHRPDTPADSPDVDLDGASPVSDEAPTVAQGLGLDDFDLYAFGKLARVTRLLQAAQDAGVFGVDGHRIAILHHASDRGHADEHYVLVTTPLRGTLCSPPVDTVELLSAHLSGVDAAVHVLTVIAEKVEQTLDQHSDVAHALWPAARPTSTRPSNPPRHPAEIPPIDATAPDPPPRDRTGKARPFRPLAVGAESLPVPDTARPTTSTRNGRRR